jgi:hypothetical protein
MLFFKDLEAFETFDAFEAFDPTDSLGGGLAPIFSACLFFPQHAESDVKGAGGGGIEVGRSPPEK